MMLLVYFVLSHQSCDDSFTLYSACIPYEVTKLEAGTVHSKHFLVLHGRPVSKINKLSLKQRGAWNMNVNGLQKIERVANSVWQLTTQQLTMTTQSETIMPHAILLQYVPNAFSSNDITATTLFQQ